MTCPICGQNNADAAQFCLSCGQALAPASAPPPPAPSTLGAPPAQPTPFVPPLPEAAPPPPPGYAPPPPTGYAAPTQSYGAGDGAPPPVMPTTPYVAPFNHQVTQPLNAFNSANCRVCGTVLAPNSYQCPKCGAPVGTIVNPNDPTSGSYLPVGGMMQMGNTSGQNGEVPPEIANLKWCWGAAGFTWIWLCAHGMAGIGIALLVLSFIPFIGAIIGLASFIYLGVNGHKLAWQKRRFDSIEHFFKVETAWKNWWIGLFIAGMILGLLAGIILAMSGGFPPPPNPGQ